MIADRTWFEIEDDELIVDGFAGGGGASEGIEQAFREAGFDRPVDIAINHSAIAMLMHKANHPRTRHIISDIYDADPVEACAGRRVGLFWISPDCTFHSVARGGKPFRDRRKAGRKRGLARVAIVWAKAVRPRVIILENVKEFEKWGPLLSNGLPCKDRAGLSFRRFVAELRNLGYQVEWRTLKACDFGAPTSRERLFLVARCDGKPIVWPEPTHGPGRPAPYRTAADIIDWSIDCPSIFMSRKQARKLGIRRPLARNTLRRIARGIYKFVIDAAEADRFIVPVMHGAEARAWSVREPLRTITGAHRGDRAVVMPYVTRIGQTGRKSDQVRGVPQPLSAVTSKAEHLLIAPTLITMGYGEDKKRNGGRGQEPRVPGLGKPIGTMVGTNHHGLVAAFLAKHYGGHETPGSRVRASVDTITGRDHHALVASHLVKLKGSSRHGQTVKRPIGAIAAKGNHYAEVQAFLIKFYKTGGQWGSLKEPMPTQTAKDRLGLVTVRGVDYVIADIGMRMLTPPELFAGQDFPPDYVIAPWLEDRRDKRGRKMKPGPISAEQQVDLCGNAVPPAFAKAMVRANFMRREEAIAA